MTSLFNTIVSAITAFVMCYFAIWAGSEILKGGGGICHTCRHNFSGGRYCALDENAIEDIFSDGFKDPPLISSCFALVCAGFSCGCFSGVTVTYGLYPWSWATPGWFLSLERYGRSRSLPKMSFAMRYGKHCFISVDCSNLLAFQLAWGDFYLFEEASDSMM